MQARYLALAFFEYWRECVSRVLWDPLRDEDPATAGPYGGGGLYFMDGTAKPATAAFRFAFVALKGRNGKLTLWGRAPRSGRATIERDVGGVWRAVAHLRTTAGGIFYAVRRMSSAGPLRAQLGSDTSPAWQP